MRVKKRVKKGVKKGIKSAKSAPPEAYLAGVGVLAGAAAVLLLATTKSGQELLSRTAERVLRPEADEQESQESDAQEEAGNEPAEDADVQEDEDSEPAEDANVQEDEDSEPAEDSDVEEEEDTNGQDESAVTDLKPRTQGPRSPRKAPRPR